MTVAELIDDLIKNLAGILTALGTLATVAITAYNAFIISKNRKDIKSGNEMTEAVGSKVDDVSEDLSKQVADLRFTNDVLAKTNKEKDVQIVKKETETQNARRLIDSLQKRLDTAELNLKELTCNKAVITENRITQLEIQQGSRTGDLG